MSDVQAAVETLTDLGVLVLSPADPRVVDQFGDFLYVASDRLRTIRLVQQRHLAAIRSSDFVWLACPDGYVGSSASMEIGFAAAVGTPVYAGAPPSDLTLRQYVHVVSGITQVLVDLDGQSSGAGVDVLVDPSSGIEYAHRQLEVVEGALLRPDDATDPRPAREAADSVRRALRHV